MKREQKDQLRKLPCCEVIPAAIFKYTLQYETFHRKQHCRYPFWESFGNIWSWLCRKITVCFKITSTMRFYEVSKYAFYCEWKSIFDEEGMKLKTKMSAWSENLWISFSYSFEIFVHLAPFARSKIPIISLFSKTTHFHYFI